MSQPAREPAVPTAYRDPGGVAVAHIDTGVNYTLPAIAAGLARDGEGELIGYDFHDDDLKPFDARPGDTRPRPQRHGTLVASILLREAPGVRLIPLRYKAKAPPSFAQALAFAARSPARIVMMSLGSAKAADWALFERALTQLPDLLVVVSAGNDGRDLDRTPLYPASLKRPNLLVVTAANPDGSLPASANWGRNTVDVSVPAEGVQALNFDGAKVRVSGSSFAVPRVAALAARIEAARPNVSVPALRAAVVREAVANPTGRDSRLRAGFIADPARPYRR
ncbi:MAG: S8 family serine peptidase [Pseudomonadota bacterium]